MNKVKIFSAIFAIVSIVMTVASLSSCEADEDYRIGGNYTLADALFTMQIATLNPLLDMDNMEMKLLTISSITILAIGWIVYEILPHLSFLKDYLYN